MARSSSECAGKKNSEKGMAGKIMIKKTGGRHGRT